MCRLDLSFNITQDKQVQKNNNKIFKKIGQVLERDKILNIVKPSALIPPNLIPTLPTLILSPVGFIQIYSVLIGDSSEVARLRPHLGA